MSPFPDRVWLVCLLWLSANASATVQHALEVSISPDDSYIEVTDTITVSGGQARELDFVLHPGLTPVLLTGGARLAAVDSAAAAQPPALNDSAQTAVPAPVHYRVELAAGQDRFTLAYHGRIRHELPAGGEQYARQFHETPGTITAAGVFLAGSSFWYPHSADEPVTFAINLRLPRDWYGMTQGERLSHEGGMEHVLEQWRCNAPQQEIYLVAGPFTEYTRRTGGVQALVLLRQPDQALAQQYLDATADYIRLYAGLIGPYPYTKFALVENFWETGYGMPSFTLLGPKVIRFPFILHSSYPHEILHNWWGNGVYVDYRRGNWAEGLTSYLADHLIREQRGQGTEYRRSTLQQYTDYVRRQQDFPLTEFRARHSAVTEAVGYGKTLMLFHMLRGELGDERFIQGLQKLYRDKLFRTAGFAAVEQAFSAVAGRPLGDFFAQWVDRSGAPQLKVAQARARAHGDGFVLSAVIEQLQDGAPYVLRVPLAIRLQGRTQAWQTVARLDTGHTTLELELPARPVQLDVDPQFDVFRRLHRNEIPPAISQALGAGRLLIVLPDAATEELGSAYRSLARDWQGSRTQQVEVITDSELEQLPDDRSVWLFGWDNRFRPVLARALAEYEYSDQGKAVRIDATRLDRNEHSIVVLGRRPGNPDHAIGWLAAGQAAALPGLGRKLPHYGKYSYLAFTGQAPDNVLKGQWPVVHSPLSVAVLQDDGMPVVPGPLQLAPRAPLASAAPEFAAERRQAGIAWPAGLSMAGRNCDVDWNDIVSRETERVTCYAGFDGLPMFSHDGKQLLFASSRAGK